MAVLAMSRDGSSAAVAARGRLLAAVHDWRLRDGSREQRAGEAASACLGEAGIRPGDIATIAIVGGAIDEHVPRLPGMSQAARACVVTAAEACLAQAAGVVDGPGIRVVVDDDIATAVVARVDSSGAPFIESNAELTNAIGLARRIGRALGCAGPTSVADMERVAGNATPEYAAALREAMRLVPAGMPFDADCVDAVIGETDRRCLGRLAEVGTAHRAVHEGRASLAASALTVMAEAFATVADTERSATGGSTVAFAGSFFATPGLNGRLARSIGGPVAVAPVPEKAGLTLGAALAADNQPVGPIRHVALGPPPDEHEIKRVLENCRLEYLYEPEWARLLPRVSAMLASGKLVGWFQPPLDFGPRSFGSRSILCDPSSRYARENVNTYLLRQHIDDPIGLSIPRGFAHEAFADVADSPFMLLDATARLDAEKRLKGVLDRQGRCPIHISDESGHPELQALLRLHHETTGVPGLINVGLQDVDGRLVSEPRGAIRAAFASAVDVLVMGRFVVTKDYWLLRSQ